MKLNGALKPHGGPKIGCSIGAKKYRDKAVTSLDNLSFKKVDKIPEQTNSGRTRESSSNNYNGHTSTPESIVPITANCNNSNRNQCCSKGITKMAMRYQQSSSLLALNFRFIRNILDSSIAFNPSSFIANNFVICITLVVVILQQPSLITCQDDNFFVSSFPGPETVTPEFGKLVFASLYIKNMLSFMFHFPCTLWKQQWERLLLFCLFSSNYENKLIKKFDHKKYKKKLK